eukprot:1154273-Pelagomonas_calceolata.AAC.1
MLLLCIQSAPTPPGSDNFSSKVQLALRATRAYAQICWVVRCGALVSRNWVNAVANEACCPQLVALEPQCCRNLPEVAKVKNHQLGRTCAGSMGLLKAVDWEFFQQKIVFFFVHVTLACTAILSYWMMCPCKIFAVLFRLVRSVSPQVLYQLAAVFLTWEGRPKTAETKYKPVRLTRGNG